MARAETKRTIFRDRALQKYIQGRDKSVLPRIVAPPVFVFCWLLLMVLMVAGLVAWLGKIPLYMAGSGVILTNNVLPARTSDEAMAVFALPTSKVGLVHPGLSVQVHIGENGPEITRSIDYVSPTILSPSEIHQQYGLAASDPALIIVTRLGPGISRQVYAGSVVQVQVLVGSQRLLSLFPVLNSLLKDA